MTFDLRRHGTNPLLLSSDGALTYADVAVRADALRDRLGPERRLVLLRGRTSVDLIITLCAVLAGRHPVIVAPPARSDGRDELESNYCPDIVIDTDAGTVDVRRDRSAHLLHPDLALLLTTSGSTGSPKLVRLSRGALRSNAASIATYLNLTDRDRALLTLPLHYCYGLSVLTSHLYAGAALVVSDHSVLDSCLWDLARHHRATGMAGVPYSFEQLDQAGFPEIPTLRYVTQAGGKLPADRVRQHVELGRSRGWDFFVMYGQTEATARMAYLPPELAAHYPGAIGVAIPGGRLRVENPDTCGVGELVYSGPNVMMGYATGAADLCRGHEVCELRTGDLGRQNAAGLFEVVGRSGRFAKLFGLRIDLDDVERRVQCLAVEVDGMLGVVSPQADAAADVAALCDLPEWKVRGVCAAVPRTSTGKPDYGTATAMVRRTTQADLASPPPAGGATTARGSCISDSGGGDDVAALFESLLGRPVRPGDTFVGLGADSLTYVELSVRLGGLLTPLPIDWHRRTIAELGRLRRPTPSRWVRVEPTVLLRALAITLIVGTHANLLTIQGGAHALLAVCGYNAARFLPSGRRAATRLATAAATIALPSAVWIGAMCTLGIYAPTSALFLNGLLGSNHWTIEWQFWFLEAAIWTLVGLSIAFCFRSIRRLDQRYPFGAAMGFVAIAATLRYALAGVEAGPIERYSIPVVLWCFAVGWAAARATTLPQRSAVAVSAAVLAFGFFDDLRRETIVAASVALLLWARPMALPGWLARGCAVLAAASLSIYLTHWQVYPHLEDRFPLAATLLSLAVGVAYHRVHGRVAGGVAVRIRQFVANEMVLDIDRGVERSTDEHRDREYVEPQQHGDRRREWAVDGRSAA